MPQKRVVIADDESLIRMYLKETLVGLGYLVVGEAGDGVSAINLARDLQPDLLIMDIKMPKLDGIRAAEVLNHERMVPVLLLTAYDDQAYVQGAQAHGVVGYLVKPFREGDLLPTIEIAMARFAELRARERQLETLKDSIETQKLVQRAKGVLMQTQGLDDAEATRRIEHLAASTEKSLKEIAQALLLARQI